LDGPGVISSQGGHFHIGDDQLTFLKSELTRLKPDRTAHKRAVLLAVHHPPLSADAKHGGSMGIQKDIDACCKAAGLWPDALLSGHAHLYQRFTRTVAAAGGKETPYIVSGSGGFAATAPKANAVAGTKVGDHVLEVAPIIDFGYLTIETDAKTLSFTFKTADQNGVAIRDSVSVDLKAGKLLSSDGPIAAPAAPAAPAARKKPAPRKKK